MQSLSRKMAYPDQQLERFLVLNALDSRVTLKPGQMVKIIL